MVLASGRPLRDKEVESVTCKGEGGKSMKGITPELKSMGKYNTVQIYYNCVQVKAK